ncbi:hypothetical protein SAMN05444339_1362 [Loktanella atrilutea]|uniref:Uncharacterized protein n=1 Tax=Loktanella atrilutea TaxID=366533 RepID=A0A1M5G5Y5_LOKAT|nr:hypothetical protein [Loktanella atrilutea]SHF98871.1 hypothetical protein SAMN05444339_1362 [Loktanella atrilutea]
MGQIDFVAQVLNDLGIETDLDGNGSSIEVIGEGIQAFFCFYLPESKSWKRISDGVTVEVHGDSKQSNQFLNKLSSVEKLMDAKFEVCFITDFK